MLIRFSQEGFTLVELMITVAIGGILLAAGIPSIMGWIQSTQVRTAAESIQNGLQLARTEAVRRNEQVRFILTDTTGLTAWTVGCVNVTAVCPVTIQTRPANEGGANARAGISLTTPLPGDYATAINAGTGMTGSAGVVFNGLGRISVGNLASAIKRIDLTNVNDANARRLVVVVTTGGQIRMCDPALDVTDTQGCS